MLSEYVYEETIYSDFKEITKFISGHKINNEAQLLIIFKKLYSILNYQLKENRSLKFTIQDPETGEPSITSFEQHFYTLLFHIFDKYRETLSFKSYFNFLEFNTEIIKSDYFPDSIKFRLICVEYYGLIASRVSSFMEPFIPIISEKHDVKLSVKISLDFFETRYLFIHDNINLDRNYEIPMMNQIVDEKEIINFCSEYISKIYESFILEGKLVQLFDYLYSLIKNSTDKRFTSLLLSRLINLNRTYLVVSEQKMNDLIEDYEIKYTSHDPSLSSLGGLSFFYGFLSRKSSRNKSFETTIGFTIPCKLKDFSPYWVKLDKDISFRCIKVENLWSDPIFIAMRNFNIRGISFSFFGDKDPEYSGEYTYVEFLINYLYIPHLELTEDGYNKINFSEKSALIGREYFPHKEFVVKQFLKHYSVFSQYLDLSKEEISINLFSPYISRITYAIDHRFYFTSAFFQTNGENDRINRGYFQRLSKLNITDDIYVIRDLLINTHINSEPNLRNFMIKLLQIFFKDNVENHGIYSLLSNPVTKLPYLETEQQKLVYTHLKGVCDCIGIQMTREGMTGNGYVDYLCTYNDEGYIYKVCIELKLAHGTVDSGITKQLPQYMKSQNSRNGIFLVLWFKDGNYSDPSKYDSISDLEEHLINIKDNDKIKLMVVDCTKPVVPSKL